jgi:8-oxo-dGTP pyrophosphatase MutT (NUDIX family)
VGEATAARRRDSARVLVCDAQWRVLLFEALDLYDGKPPLWITPGGGLEPGEDPATAAARELFEETGLELTPATLGAPIAVSGGRWTFRGELMESVDSFFLTCTDALEVSQHGWTDLERRMMRTWRWWTADELAATDERVAPGGLATLLARLASGWRPDAGPVELPWRHLAEPFG